ncbi:hypothetical protein [Alcanivorax sp. 1008]|uniref:hypothetical protein n=1 Tax=Alcanivorax sp. 1008 TaxID=2816853 RepID=UPI001DF457DB|nr:hypothetical protein [Alcanivorax sp. 1008]MCC1496732.1 hypothetical protein [Alcanivorax sp. 1008]
MKNIHRVFSSIVLLVVGPLAFAASDEEWQCPLEGAQEMEVELRVEQAQTGFLVSALEAADANGDGLITRREAGSVRGVIADFDDIDVNRDDQVTVQEVADWLRSRLTLQARVMMRMGDANKDGVVTREEANRYPLLKKNYEQLAAGGDQLTEDEIFLALLDVARKADLGVATKE